MARKIVTEPLTPELRRALDALSSELEGDLEVHTSRTTLRNMGFTGTGILLTAGYLTWLLRGGSLLASLLATFPTWRFVDPLPILALSRRERKERLRSIRAARRDEAAEQAAAEVLGDNTWGKRAPPRLD